MTLIQETQIEPYGDGRWQARFLLKGDRGSVQFNCVLGENQTFPDEPNVDGRDVGYHSHLPMHSNQTPCECDIHGQCYYGGSSMTALEWAEKFKKHGTVWLWPRLEQYYMDTLGGTK